ncbi:MAG: hypothetical protein K2X27_19845 [Candidatus Obscuribacterales bacterium]|nr:hypothetical protein [Candidatus Obscuribacterales bacterium]
MSLFFEYPKVQDEAKVKQNLLFHLIISLTVMSLSLANPALAENSVDWMTACKRETIHIKQWPNGKKVAVCFVLYVEEWGIGKGPNFREDMLSRKPDFVNESFRQYAINSAAPRVARLFASEKLPLSIALSALFPSAHPEPWNEIRKTLPGAAIIAHGMNNSSDQLPIGQGVTAQQSYVARTLSRLEKDSGIKVRGWSSPSVYADADTFSAIAAEGIKFTLDSMDSDYLSRLQSSSGPLILIPYPPVTVDMGQFFQRYKSASDMERLWIDYVRELEKEASENPKADATIVAIGIHPFVVGTPDGAQSLRRVLEKLKSLKLVWIADLEQVMNFLDKCK